MADVSASALMTLWSPVVVYMAAIFYVSSLQNPPTPPGVIDVDLHALAYFGLMVVVLRAVCAGRWVGVTLKTIAIAWAITVAYGLTDEWHQMYVPTRHAELRDAQANAIGALVAGIGAKAWSIIRRL